MCKQLVSFVEQRSGVSTLSPFPPLSLFLSVHIENFFAADRIIGIHRRLSSLLDFSFERVSRAGCAQSCRATSKSGKMPNKLFGVFTTECLPFVRHRAENQTALCLFTPDHRQLVRHKFHAQLREHLAGGSVEKFPTAREVFRLPWCLVSVDYLIILLLFSPLFGCSASLRYIRQCNLFIMMF